MNEKRTSVFSNGLIWFGAGVSLAEILTGTYFAPLGFGRAMAAILARSSDRRTYDVCGRNDRSERAQKCHGNCKNELWREGKPSFCRIKCITACWMDCDHDL